MQAYIVPADSINIENANPVYERTGIASYTETLLYDADTGYTLMCRGGGLTPYHQLLNYNFDTCFVLPMPSARVHGWYEWHDEHTTPYPPAAHAARRAARRAALPPGTTPARAALYTLGMLALLLLAAHLEWLWQ